ncbi:MAG TPA: MarR family transcriptional regulator [Pirellulales bacterium]|nr:MarR family transcriptional regulator [Pirellulales bacterium]
MAANRTTQLKTELVDALRRHSGSVVLLHAAIAERLGLGPADHKCLDLLLRFGPLPAGDLADKSALTTGAITGVIDRLEKAGYAVRASDPHDRRRVVVEPNRERALADIEPIFAGLKRGMSAMLDRYSAEELELLLDFLKRIDQLIDDHTAALRRA